jgi:hypothetical protein
MGMKHSAILLVLVACYSVRIGSAAQSPALNQPAKFDVHRLKTGTFRYSDVERGQNMGESQIGIEQIAGSGDFRFSNVTTGKFSQRWVAVTTPTFAAISANLSFGAGTGTPAFDLAYTSGRVTGFVVDRKGPTAGTKRPVNDSVPSTVVDQRIDWAAVSASDFQSNPDFEFEVYDPAIGISHVFAKSGPLQSVRVPAGEFQVYPITYEIRKRTGNETYKVFVTKQEPRMLVREDFPDGSESDLAAISLDDRNGRP